MVYAFLPALPLHTSTAYWDYMITSELALPVHVSVSDEEAFIRQTENIVIPARLAGL